MLACRRPLGRRRSFSHDFDLVVVRAQLSSFAQGREVKVHVLVVRVEIDDPIPVSLGLLPVLDVDRSGGSADAVVSESSFGSLLRNKRGGQNVSE